MFPDCLTEMLLTKQIYPTDLERDGRPSILPFPTFEPENRFGGLITVPPPEPVQTTTDLNHGVQQGASPTATQEACEGTEYKSPAEEGKLHSRVQS